MMLRWEIVRDNFIEEDGMMREIKFRAWDKDYMYMNHKVMVGNVWDEDNYHAHVIWVDAEDVDYECESGWMNFDEHSNIEIMQYTELKDNNGVDIYEGDIIWDAHAEIHGKVTFDEGAFCVEWDTHIEHLNEVVSDYYAEVIGNIYENPELMERK